MKKYIFAFLLIPLFYFPCYISKDLVFILTKEDGAYEYAGALLFLLSAIVFFILATSSKYYISFKNTKEFPKRKYFWLFAFLFFFAFGEEISWGQRIFNFETPEAIKSINIQNEFNIHNLNGLDGRTIEGVQTTGIKALFALHRLFYLAFLIYLLVIPFIYSLNTKFKRFIDNIHLPVPNIMLGVFFAYNLACGKTLRALNDETIRHGIVEIKEFVCAIILFMFALSLMRFSKISGKAL